MISQHSEAILIAAQTSSPTLHRINLMTGLEPLILKLPGYLAGLSQKCIVESIKRWKIGRDQREASKASSIIAEHESAKAVSTKLEQSITKSICGLKLTEQQVQEILLLETNPLVQEKLVERFSLSDITPDYIEELFITQNPRLEDSRSEVHLLALCWLDAVDKTIAADTELSNLVSLRSSRAMRQDLRTVEAELVKANLRDDEAEEDAKRRHKELLAAILSSQSGYALQRASDVEDSIPDHLKTQNQRRFERAKKYLLEGSIVNAEREFLGLSEDLEALNNQNDSDQLLLRCYLNIAISLWEQNRQPDAIAWFDKAYTMNPADWRAKRGRAFTFLFQKKVNEALALFAEIRQLRPNESEHVCNEAWLLKNSGRNSEAIGLLESRTFEDVHYFSMLSLTYTRAERYDEAEYVARKALQFGNSSEVAQIALSCAIGFPIIQKSGRHDTLNFTPSQTERVRLFEAIQNAETAAATLRKQGRVNVLFDALSNLTAFYPTVGDCERAENAAQEALRISPNDATILRNLWCIQMRLEKSDEAVVTAAKLETLDNHVDWWERKSESLLQADRAQEVLDSWNSIKSDANFSANSDVVGIVARAFSNRHRTEEGLQLLEENLLRRPSDPVLLLDRGILLEGLGRIGQAKESFEAAQQNANKDCRSQILICYGMFLYRQHDWHTAAEKLKALGAESVHNPLCGHYVVCLFNQGIFRESLALAEMAIKERKEFIEDFYAIAARCHHICENFSRARALLEVLVAKGGSRKIEHVKLLAWACWRMDDLPQAYEVLLNALNAEPNDLDLLNLMTAVCTLLHKYDAAIAYGFKAIEFYPEALASNTAFIRAMFALPQNSKPDQKYLDAYFKSLSFLERHESGILQAVPIEPDTRSILAIVKARSEEIGKFEENFKKQPLPMSLFARRVGRTIFTIWTSFLRHPEIKIRMSFGPLEEQHKEAQEAFDSREISIDLFAILTLQHLRLLHLLPKMFLRIFVHASVLDDVVTSLREMQSPGAAGTLTLKGGKLVSQIPSQEDLKSTIEFLATIRDFIKSSNVEIVGLLPETTKTGNSQLLIEACGMAGISPMLVAKEKSVALFADDACLRAIGPLNERPQGFCTQAFLRAAVQRNLLSIIQYEDAVIKMIQSNYAFVSEDAGILKRCYTLSEGKITPLTLQLINRINHPYYDQESCLPLLADFAVFVWRDNRFTGADGREDWHKEIWQAISKASHSEELAMKFISKLAVMAPSQPFVLFGIMDNLFFQLSFFRQQKDILVFLLNQAAYTMSRVIRQTDPLCIELPQQWQMQARLNKILVRQGFLEVYDIFAETDVKKNKRSRKKNKRKR